MKFIGVIAARANSKGIKNKNIFMMNKKPLIEYTFDAARKSKLKDIYLLSDSDIIKKKSKKFSIISEYKRPKKLSNGKVSLADTVYDFYLWTKKNQIFFDYMCILQPTSPLRNFQDINNSINIIKKEKPKSLFSVSNSLEHPYEVVKNSGKKKWSYVLKKSKKFTRRQDFDLETFFINGAIYIAHSSLIKKKKIYNLENHCTYTMPKHKSLEINDLEDTIIVNSLLKNKKI